jgi:hypothetical protein
MSVYPCCWVNHAKKSCPAEFGIVRAQWKAYGNHNPCWREPMALEKKPLISKKASTSAAPQMKRNVKEKVDISKPSPTKVATAMRILP